MDRDQVGTGPPATSPDGSPIYGLVCSGGGVKGAYQVGVLWYVHERFCRGKRSPFQVFTGISCGSINTTFLATGSHRAAPQVQRLRQLWLDFHVPEYFQEFGRQVRRAVLRRLLRGRRRARPFWSVLDPGPMERLFANQFDRPGLDRAVELGATLGVGLAAKDPTYNLSTWFVEGPNAVEWYRHHAIAVRQRLGAEHMCASCSVPLYFPPVRIGDRFYFDGAVHLERPFSAAVSMGATRILAVTADPGDHDPNAVRPTRLGSSVFNVVRSMLSVYNHDFMRSEMEQIRVLNRFASSLGGPRSTGGSPAAAFNAVFDERHHPGEYVPITVELISPSRPLRALVEEFIEDQMDGTPRPTNGSLLFHRDFIRRLIALGYEDARREGARLERFFEAAVTPRAAVSAGPRSAPAT